MPTLMQPISHRDFSGVAAEARDIGAVDVDAAIRDRLEACAYRFCFSQVAWSLEEDTLVLTGRVPSFYLKQVLQTLVRGLGEVRRIDNRVEVVSSTGLSTPPEVP